MRWEGQRESQNIEDRRGIVNVKMLAISLMY